MRAEWVKFAPVLFKMVADQRVGKTPSRNHRSADYGTCSRSKSRSAKLRSTHGPLPPSCHINTETTRTHAHLCLPLLSLQPCPSTICRNYLFDVVAQSELFLRIFDLTLFTGLAVAVIAFVSVRAGKYVKCDFPTPTSYQD